MESSKTNYVDNSNQLFSVGLTIRQKEPKNLEAPFDQIELLSYSDGTVLHPQSFSDTDLGPRFLSTAHRRRCQESACVKLRRVAQHAI